MDLPLIGHLAEKEKEEPEYFLALEITNARVKSAVWVVVNNQTEVVVTGTTAYWQGKEVEELVRATNDSLASLAQKLSETTEKEPSKVVLGLPASWVGEDSKIVEERIDYLRELTKRLELSLVGFVVTTEALVQYLKGQEGVPPSVILVELAEEEIEVTLVHLGKVLGRQRVARSIDLGADLEEGLTRFLPQAIFPSRISIFDGHASLEETRQRLLDHPWAAKGSKLPFLHLPKVEILSEEETVKAVALAGGMEAAKAIGLVLTPPVALKGAEEEGGLAEDEDIGEAEAGPEAGVEGVAGEEGEAEAEAEEDRSEEFGFVKMGDVRQLRPVPEVPAASGSDEEREGPAVRAKDREMSSFEWVRKMGQNLGLRTAGLETLAGKFYFGRLVLVAVALVAVAGVAVFGWWFFAKASVTVEVQPKALQKKMVLVLDPKASAADLAGGVIPVQGFSGQASGQKSIGTTGRKTVGTKAHGTVGIYNALGTAERLSAGMLLTSGSELKFSLNEAVVVASASGTADNNLTPGQATVGVTAADVGSEYNLAGGTVFGVPGFTQLQMVAKNTEAFAGGDKRETQAVDKSDLTKLSGQLTDELTPKARDDLMAKIPAEFQLVDRSLTFKAQDQAFDRKADDEATAVALTESVVAEALAITTADKQKMVSGVSEEAFPQGYSVDQEKSSIDFGKLKVGSGKGTGIKVEAGVKLVALPFIKREELAARIAGKDKVTADRILAKTPGFIREEIKISPGLFSVVPFLPVRAERVAIIINPRQD